MQSSKQTTPSSGTNSALSSEAKKRKLTCNQSKTLHSAKRSRTDSPADLENNLSLHSQSAAHAKSPLSAVSTSSWHTALSSSESYQTPPLIPLYRTQTAQKLPFRPTGVTMVIYDWPPGRQRPQRYQQMYFRLLKHPVRRSWDPTLTNVQLYERRRIMNASKFDKSKRNLGAWIGPPTPYK